MEVQKAITFQIQVERKGQKTNRSEKEITVKRWTDKSESLAKLY